MPITHCGCRRDIEIQGLRAVPLHRNTHIALGAVMIIVAARAYLDIVVACRGSEKILKTKLSVKQCIYARCNLHRFAAVYIYSGSYCKHIMSGAGQFEIVEVSQYLFHRLKGKIERSKHRQCCCNRHKSKCTTESHPGISNRFGSVAAETRIIVAETGKGIKSNIVVGTIELNIALLIVNPQRTIDSQRISAAELSRRSGTDTEIRHYDFIAWVAVAI